MFLPQVTVQFLVLAWTVPPLSDTYSAAQLTVLVRSPLSAAAGVGATATPTSVAVTATAERAAARCRNPRDAGVADAERDVDMGVPFLGSLLSGITAEASFLDHGGGIREHVGGVWGHRRGRVRAGARPLARCTPDGAAPTLRKPCAHRPGPAGLRHTATLTPPVPLHLVA